MNLSAPFIRRPIATVLLTIGLALAGVAAMFNLPIANLPNVDYPAISVSATLAGASPISMAADVATPLERRLGTIAGVNEITSNNSTGSSRIQLQFDLNKDIDQAAREVQAAINASRADLPATLRQNPTYRKFNSASQPVLILAMTSDTLTPGQIYDAVSNIVQQRLSQVPGVGDVEVGGSSQPAIRVELDPFALNHYGISGEDVRAAIQSANANRPKGVVAEGPQRLQIYTSTGGTKAADYVGLIIAYRSDRAVRLSDVASVTDSVQDLHTLGLFNGKPAIVVPVTQQAGANVIQVVDGVMAVLPDLQQQLPPDVHVQVAQDSTSSIRASLREVGLTLIIAIILVILVVSAFLRSFRATIIPAVATVVSLLGAFGCMYLLGFSINNLSLMAMTVASGFVVDDAIVVLENTSRHLEAGMNRFEAALEGAKEVGFTVVSMSTSLVAVFIPLLFMGGQIGRLFREFAVTLSAAVMISLLVSLTTTPMMCAWLLRSKADERPPGRISRAFESVQRRLVASYEVSLDWALSSRRLVILILIAVIGLNFYLYSAIPKGFFPQQDSGRLFGGLRADQSISSEEMGRKLQQVVNIIRRDPTVDTVVAFTGGGGRGGGGGSSGGFLSVQLKPVSQRKDTGLKVIARLRPQLARVTGLSIFLNPAQDVRMGGRQTNATYQYTLKSDNAADLKTWAQKLADAMSEQPVLEDVNTDQQDNGVEVYVDVDKDTASRLGVNLRDVDNALYDNFGQRQVATIYEDLNQYTVVMEADPAYSRSPDALSYIYVPANGTAVAATVSRAAGSASLAAAVSATQALQAAQSGATTTTATTGASAGGPGQSASGRSGAGGVANAVAGGTQGGAGRTTTTTTAASGAASAAAAANANPGARDPSTGSALNTSARRMVPLSAFAHFAQRAAPASVNHQDTELATTVSFNLPEGTSLSDAQKAIGQAEAQIAMPSNVRGSFQGTAQAFTQSLSQEPILILAALITIYIVLGVLYENLVHPITVLSTLPSAGVGAILALMLFQMEFSIIALIGVFLLIGLVKKNAILIIDFALEAERSRNLSAIEAVRRACMLRFRPILMTTLAAGLGALPLAIGFGEGSELRRPLGVAIIGGLIASQLLTLLTTPVVYVYLDRLRRRRGERHLSRAGGSGEVQPA